MTSCERRLANHVVTLASCKLEFTVLELVLAAILHHAARINHQHGFTLASFRARGEDRTLRSYTLQRSLISGCDLCTRIYIAVLRAYISSSRPVSHRSPIVSRATPSLG